jgi:hypothetical protein
MVNETPNILVTNQWGARIIVCPTHLSELLVNVYGDIVKTPTAEIGCRRCAEEAERAANPGKVRAALLDPTFSHSRFKRGNVYIYRRDVASPSGVYLAAAASEKVFDEIYDDLLAQGLIRSSASPLSPTELR